MTVPAWGGDKKAALFETIDFLDGVNARQSEAIAVSLGEIIIDSFKTYLTESHFIFGGNCFGIKDVDCRQNLLFRLEFKTASLDLDGDGKNELIVGLIGLNECGSGGCTYYILKKYKKGWVLIGEIFGLGSDFEVSKVTKNGFKILKWTGKYTRKTYNCIFQGTKYTCP